MASSGTDDFLSARSEMSDATDEDSATASHSESGGGAGGGATHFGNCTGKYPASPTSPTSPKSPAAPAPRLSFAAPESNRLSSRSDVADDESSCSESGNLPDVSSSSDDESVVKRRPAMRHKIQTPILRQLSVVYEATSSPDGDGTWVKSGSGWALVKQPTTHASVAADAAAAAARVQAYQRGRQLRRGLAEEAAAAAKVQAILRGRQQRRKASARRRARSVPLTFEEATAPRPYLIVACSYPGSKLEIKGVRSEAEMVVDCAKLVTRIDDCSVAELRAKIESCRGLHLLCHGDAPLHGECVPLLGSGHRPEAVSLEALIGLIRPAALAGSLRHVYLGGCKTRALGFALHAQAAVPCVVCYEHKVHDDAASLFGAEFVRATARGEGPVEAFSAARARVLAETEPGVLDNGLPGRVQRFSFVDPEASEVHRCVMLKGDRAAGVGAGAAALPDVCAVTGRPWGQCHWRGRLSPPKGMRRVAPSWRGRLASGEPSMLLRDADG